MTSTHKNLITSLTLLLLIFFGASNIAAASEITGTLSSDGSAETQQGTVLSETNTNSTAGQEIAQNTQNSGQLQGSVTGGREDGTAALSDSVAWNASVWAVPVAVLALAALAYFLWRRKLI